MAKKSSSKADTEFYYRYRSFLLQACRKGCMHFDDGEQLADDIFQNAIIKALNGVNNLYEKLSPETTKTSNHIKAWLSVIAKNELNDFLRKNPDERNLTNRFRIKADEIDIPIEIDDKMEQMSRKPSMERAKLDKALETLSPREKDILITYMFYQSEYNPNGHLPDEVIAGLCKKHNTSSDNLRQIKRRALLKLKHECGR